MTPRRSDLRIAPAPTGGDARALASAADGERLLQAEGLGALRAALRDSSQPATGWAHSWRGYALQFDDLVPARSEWLRAEACFERDRDASGLDAVACGLIQCALLDSLSYAGFDGRAARVEKTAPAAAVTPLALFFANARLLLAVERREATES